MKFDKPIALAADHGGYELKEAIKAHLDELGVAYTDFGTDSTASVDYPDFAAKGCKAVQDGSCALVILCCGTGVGMSMCANKMKGIRYLQRRVYPPPQQRQRPLPGRACRGRGSGLPDRGRLPERRVRGRTPPDAHRQDDGAGKPLSFTLPARQAEYL
jgi:hypothetical protein